MSDDDTKDKTPVRVPPEVAARQRRRPYLQSPDERDSIGRRARTTPLEFAPLELDVPEAGAPAYEFIDEYTSPHELLERIRSPEVRSAIEDTWKHLANVNRRTLDKLLEVAAQRGDENTGKRLTALEIRSLVVSGEDGNNGRLGNLRADVRKIRALLVAVAVVLLGGIGGAAKLLDDAAERRGRERAEIEHMRSVVERLADRQESMRSDLLVLKVKAGAPLDILVPGDLP
ncbi:MAG: hypothetical protein M3R63_18520 [Actinomycetota bacterium]|nr:hypothetical protein [Actinomycetota bacterium]